MEKKSELIVEQETLLRVFGKIFEKMPGVVPEGIFAWISEEIPAGTTNRQYARISGRISFTHCRHNSLEKLIKETQNF